ALGRSERTVWRWLAGGRAGRLGRVPGGRFVVTAEVRQLLALWGGNASRVHAELVERARLNPSQGLVPSLATLHPVPVANHTPTCVNTDPKSLKEQ
ncbi:hypothetical protein AB0L99_35785, partial [Streptomyces sp. NPDC051954]